MIDWCTCIEHATKKLYLHLYCERHQSIYVDMALHVFTTNSIRSNQQKVYIKMVSHQLTMLLDMLSPFAGEVCVGTLPTWAHQVRGQLCITNQSALVIRNFYYDSGGPGTCVRVHCLPGTRGTGELADSQIDMVLCTCTHTSKADPMQTTPDGLIHATNNLYMQPTCPTPHP